MRSRGSWGSTVQMPWVATVLAAALALTTPVAATLVGERSAGPLGHITVVTAALEGSTTQVLGGDPRWPPPPTSFAPHTLVLAAHDEASHDRAAAHAPAPARWEPRLVVAAEPGMVARAEPWSGAKVIAQVPTTSRYYRVPLQLWVEAVSPNGRWGRVAIPYAWPHRTGWVALDGLHRHRTDITVKVDLSEHLVRVYRRERLLVRVSGAIGASVSPTPTGDYVVTDRVPFAVGSALGSFAFGISGIQPNLPPGWSGGDQLAIHGTNDPSSIGRSVSAGCVRVSEAALAAFRPLLELGTPVQIRA